MKISKTWMFGLGLALAGCPGDDSPPAEDTGSTSSADTGSGSTTSEPMTTTMEPDTDSADSSTGDTPEACLGENEMGSAVGDGCTRNEECISGVCTIFTDAPINADAVCADTPADCGTRVTGTVFDFETREPVPDANVTIAAALAVATMPTTATPIVEATSGADGRIDVTSEMPIMAAIGIVALSSAPSYYLTSTGVASPAEGQSYEVGTGNHDLWLVSEEALGNWSTELGNDVAIDPGLLPLGDAGGVVGFVRDGDGNPVAGATVASTNDASTAVVRYLNDDGSFGDIETSDTGIFVILDPAVPEDFEASVAGAVVGGGTAGSAPSVLFTLIITAD